MLIVLAVVGATLFGYQFYQIIYPTDEAEFDKWYLERYQNVVDTPFNYIYGIFLVFWS